MECGVNAQWRKNFHFKLDAFILLEGKDPGQIPLSTYNKLVMLFGNILKERNACEEILNKDDAGKEEWKKQEEKLLEIRDKLLEVESALREAEAKAKAEAEAKAKAEAEAKRKADEAKKKAAAKKKAEAAKKKIS